MAVVVTCTKRDLGLGGGLVEEKQVSRRGKGIREVIGAGDDHWHSISLSEIKIIKKYII